MKAGTVPMPRQSLAKMTRDPNQLRKLHMVRSFRNLSRGTQQRNQYNFKKRKFGRRTSGGRFKRRKC